MTPQPTHPQLLRPPTFQEHIDRLPEHQSCFFQHIEWVLTPEELWTELQAKEKVLVASDGGAKQGGGSLGLTIGDTQANVLAKG
jgi:hypothetical protein